MNVVLYLDYKFAQIPVLGAPLSSILFQDIGAIEVFQLILLDTNSRLGWNLTLLINIHEI